MKTFILTDNYLEEPLKIEAKDFDEAMNKISDYYKTQINYIEAAKVLYNMKLYELDDLETLI